MAKKSILVYNLTEGTISGEDDLGYQLSIPVVQESEQPLPDIKFNLSGLDLEHLDGDTTVMLYYDEDERGDYKDIQLTMISDDNWLVGLDTSHTDRKGWRRAFQYYPKSYEDDRDYNYHQIQESTSQELEEETKSQDTLSAKTESSSIENSEEQSPSQTANHNDEELLSQDCPSTQSINPSNNRQESTLANAKAVSGTQLDTNTHSNIDQDALEYIMSTGEDTSYLEGFYDPATETRALASSYPTSENKKDDSSPSAINQLAMEIELESESSSNTDSSTGALDKLMDDISREAELCSPINDRCDDSSTRALQKLMDDISREAQPCSPTENASNGPLSDLPDDLIEALT